MKHRHFPKYSWPIIFQRSVRRLKCLLIIYDAKPWLYVNYLYVHIGLKSASLFIVVYLILNLIKIFRHLVYYCQTSIIASGRDQIFVDLQLKSMQLSRNFFIQ